MIHVIRRISRPVIVAASLTPLALALFLILRRYNIALGVPTIVAGHVVFNSAYATLIIQARLATMTEVLEEAAADLGAPPRRVFRRVTLPLLMPAVIVAALLTLSFSFDDVVTSLFLGGTNAETLPVLLLGLIRLHVTPEVNAIASGVTTITLVTFALSAVVISLRWPTISTRANRQPRSRCSSRSKRSRLSPQQQPTRSAMLLRSMANSSWELTGW